MCYDFSGILLVIIRGIIRSIGGGQILKSQVKQRIS